MPDAGNTPSAGALEDASIGEALRFGAQILSACDTPQLDARVLLKHALDTDEDGLIARAEDRIEEAARARYVESLYRRIKDEPVAYITGVKEFWSLEFRVTPDVLIPRNDSECLIEAALARRRRDEHLRILDLGTGSGCLLCALLSEFPKSEGAGVDQSEGALDLAGENAGRLGLGDRARFLKGDWCGPVEGVFDLIIVNPPYISDADGPELARCVTAFEPNDALFGGPDGLDPYRRILAEAPAYLAEGGLLLMECGVDQTERLTGLAQHAGLSGGETFTLFDLSHRPRGLGVDRRKL